MLDSAASAASDIDRLRDQVERVRSRGALGRSSAMHRLFDYLAERSLAGRTPKEIEVAIEVFDKPTDFDVSQDAIVRVYVHKLRRKLEAFYASAGIEEPVRLVIPKGEYRLAIEDADRPAALAAEESRPGGHEPGSAARPGDRLRSWIAAGLVAAFALNAVVLFALFALREPAVDEFRDVRASAVWAPLFSDRRPIFVVVGDYYIFGETDERMEVKRLVREFDINSRDDLDQHLKLHPALADRYLDLDLAYLPTASAFALRDIAPVLAAGRADQERVRVVLMSELTPAMLKSAHIVYIGFLSGLGKLRDTVFAGSRFAIGDTYDELVDRATRHRYVSQAGSPFVGNAKYHDYGYFSTFPGPNGNRIVIIAGTRDVAVMETADALTDRSRLDELERRASGARAFEALIEVYGLDRMNLNGKLLVASRLDTANLWGSKLTGSTR